MRSSNSHDGMKYSGTNVFEHHYYSVGNDYDVFELNMTWIRLYIYDIINMLVKYNNNFVFTTTE